MKKIVIVNNNMKVGGVQKSLYNLLWAMDAEHLYDVTLLLFRKTGEYVDKLPPSVRVVECDGPFRYLGMSQSECADHVGMKISRGFLALISRLFGRRWAIRLMLMKQSPLSGEYDCAISYLHNGRKESFYGGVQDYVLSRVHAKKKVAFIHGDYGRCGANHPANNRMMERFDRIAACSDGCRRTVEAVLPHLKDKCITVPNCHRYDEIRALAEEDPLLYDPEVVNAVTVSRLSHEKGIERAIQAVADARTKGLPVKLHIVGGGPMGGALTKLVTDMHLDDSVVFLGEQSNPYRYMKNADLLLLTSFHEAAPMVVDEARFLSLPVLTTATTSSQEMVTDVAGGWVCENDQMALSKALCDLAGNRDALRVCKEKLAHYKADNNKALARFHDLMEI